MLIETESKRFEVDFVIVATGFVTDLAARPELARFEAQIARWADRYTPPSEETHEDLLRHPYLGPGFEFTERKSGAGPVLGSLLQLHVRRPAQHGLRRRQHLGHEVFSAAAGRRASPARCSSEDSAAHFDSLCHFAEPEF